MQHHSHFLKYGSKGTKGKEVSEVKGAQHSSASEEVFLKPTMHYFKIHKATEFFMLGKHYQAAHCFSNKPAHDGL